jgi:alpha-1,6-mannosyltransferase
VLAMKVVVVSFDLLAYGLLILTLAARQQPPARSILYGWNPLVIKVFAGSGHIDAVLVAALAATCYFLTRKKPTAAAVSLGLAIATKVAPVVLLPFFARRAGGWRTVVAGATSVACFVPYLGAGRNLFAGLQAFSAGWQFNSGPFRLIAWTASLVSSHADLLARMTSASLLIAVLIVLYRHDDGDPRTFARVATIALGAVLICSPVVTPWYVTWLLPFAVVAGIRAPIFFSAAVCLAFLVMVRGIEWPWALALEYGALSTAIAWEIRRRVRPARVRV